MIAAHIVGLMAFCENNISIVIEIFPDHFITYYIIIIIILYAYTHNIIILLCIGV